MGREHILHMHMTGAVDLLPFHPVGGASMEDAAQTSRTVAERVGRELGTNNLDYITCIIYYRLTTIVLVLLPNALRASMS